MYLKEVLKDYVTSLESLDKITVVEEFFAMHTYMEGSICQRYVEEGRAEEYARDQTHFAILCGCSSDAMLDTPELKMYFAIKTKQFSALAYMYDQRINDDLMETAWEVFKVAHPTAGRDLFDGVRSGNPEALAQLQSLNTPTA